jgi:hypothetical protein
LKNGWTTTREKKVIVGSNYGPVMVSSSDYEVRYVNLDGDKVNMIDLFQIFNCPDAFLQRFNKYGFTKYKHDCGKFLIDSKLSKKLKLLKAKQKSY